MEEDSILTSIKNQLGVTEAEEHYDSEIITYINSDLSVLNQLGIGPADGYAITGKANVWSELFTDKRLGFVKTHVFLKTKLIFDPPLSSIAVDAMKAMIEESECRILEVLERVPVTEVITEVITEGEII